MFKTQNFCHIASNNRNQVKAGVFVYRTTDNLATVSASGYFNARIIDINLHDLIIHEKIDASDATKVERNVLCVTERTLENVGVTVIKSKWEEDIEGDIEDLDGKIAALKTYVEQHFVNIDGSSIMSGPLKFRAGSFVGAIAGGLGDGISFYKLKNDNTIDSEVASLTKTNGFTPGTTNTMNIGSSSLKWKDLYVARVIASVLNNGADISVPTTGGTLALNDFSNITDSAKNIGNWSNNVTNCITEIPQDIKLELNGGTLTLKAGSKVYVPNGSGVFNTVTTTQDISVTISGAAGQYYIYKNPGNNINYQALATIVSGTTDSLSGTPWHVWYDTTNNVINRYTADGTTPIPGQSFPIAIVTVSGGQITSINQVFNGFGYIGSTVFILPNVKVLTSDGFNADGTLKNKISTSATVNIKTLSSTCALCVNTSLGIADRTSYYVVKNKKEMLNINASGVYYVIEENLSYSWSGGSSTMYKNFAYIGSCQITSGKITYFSINKPFHAVDYSDTNYIAHQSMPSDRYVDLTLPSSGGTITAPADGYIYLNKTPGSADKYLQLTNQTANGMGITVNSYNGTLWTRIYLPVSKGDVVVIHYDFTGSTNAFCFIYANGAK